MSSILPIPLATETKEWSTADWSNAGLPIKFPLLTEDWTEKIGGRPIADPIVSPRDLIEVISLEQTFRVSKLVTDSSKVKIATASLT